MAKLGICSPRRVNRFLDRLPRGWIVLPALLLFRSPELPAQTLSSPEYQVKAIFLFNFAEFVEWPPEAFPKTEAPLIIGILGDDPFGPYLDETIRGETVNDRPLAVQRYRQVEEIKTCHMLFISRTEADRLELILASLKGLNILTVADAEGFAKRGVIVRFVIEQNKIRLKINLEAAKAANLTISSKLLRPAEIVTSEKE